MHKLNRSPRCDDQLAAACQATRQIFFAVGLAMASWAPMVPFAKLRIGLSEATLGLVLLGLGAGAMAAMPAASMLIRRWGLSPVMLVVFVLSCVMLPLLALVRSAILLTIFLLVFGACLGTLDVAINAHAVAVEQRSSRPLMSGFHALFSVGGLSGAAGVSFLLWLGLPVVLAAGCVAVVVGILGVSSLQHVLAQPRDDNREIEKAMQWPGPAVVLIGLLCFISFLAEGAMLDWGAMFLSFSRHVRTETAGIGYAAFSIAMAIGRFTGDRITRRLGAVTILRLSGALAAIGLFVAVLTGSAGAALVGFALVGLGASNIVPQLFSAVGRRKDTPPSLSIPFITTFGYAGILLGPALIGFVARLAGLPVALAGVACLLLLVTFSANVAKP